MVLKELGLNRGMSKGTRSRVKFRVDCGNQAVKGKENHNQPDR